MIFETLLGVALVLAPLDEAFAGHGYECDQDDRSSDESGHG